jgi:hypothetical protein
MRTILALLAIATLGGSVVACGDTSSNTVSDPHTSSRPAATNSTETTVNSHTVPPGGYLKSDSDADSDDHQDTGPSSDDQQEMGSAVRHGASSADKRAITSIVRRYYAAAAIGDGTKGCSLLASSLATAITTQQSQLANRTCAASLARLFKQQHQHLTAENATTMVVTGVHVSKTVGFVTLGFKKQPEGELVIQREDGTWKINALFDSPLP